MEPIVIFVDGGCRNNGCPGSVAYGSFKVFHRGDLKRTVSFDLPDAHTSNQAEYNSLMQAVLYLEGEPKRLSAPVVIKTDSQLVVGQLTQNWKVKDEGLKYWHLNLKAFFTRNPNIHLEKVDRSEIVKVLGH
jgi:ribonuclease HI